MEICPIRHRLGVLDFQTRLRKPLSLLFVRVGSLDVRLRPRLTHRSIDQGAGIDEENGVRVSRVLVHQRVRTHEQSALRQDDPYEFHPKDLDRGVVSNLSRRRVLDDLVEGVDSSISAQRDSFVAASTTTGPVIPHLVRVFQDVVFRLRGSPDEDSVGGVVLIREGVRQPVHKTAGVAFRLGAGGIFEGLTPHVHVLEGDRMVEGLPALVVLQSGPSTCTGEFRRLGDTIRRLEDLSEVGLLDRIASRRIRAGRTFFEGVTNLREKGIIG